MSKDNGNNSFLSQFEGKSYSDNKKEPAPDAKKTIPRAAPARPQTANEQKSKIQGPDHLVAIDNGYHKRKLAKWGIIGGVAILIAVLGFFGLRMARAVEVMDFTGQNWNQATQWGLQHGVTVQRNDAYNLEFDEGNIFAQNIEAGTSVQRGSVIILDVSQGADPSEVLTLPDFEAMTTGQVQTWRTQMRATGAVQVREEHSDAIEAGRFITLEYPPSVDLDHFTRRDSLTVIMSSGPRIFTMPNFVGRTQTDVEQWAEENDIQVTFEERAEEEAELGIVLAQNIEPRARFSNDDDVIITISAGEAVIIPNFALLSQEDVADLEGIVVQRRDRLNPNVAFGRLISQSIPAGTEIIGVVPKVTLVYSLGRPFMASLIGQTENILPQHFFEEFTARGANITYAIRYVDSYHPRGEIVNMSRHSEFVGMNDHIIIDVSRGNLRPPVTTDPPAFDPPSGGDDWPEDQGLAELG